MRLLMLIVMLSSLVSLTGCSSSSRTKDIEAFLKPDEAVVTSKEYVLLPPDEIEIRCTKVPEIHLQKQTVRPDGYVTFENFGSIYVAGKTPEQVADMLKTKILELYSLSGNYPIDIQVAGYRSKFYYVLGEVERPGPKIYTGRDMAFSAIAAANPTILAQNKRIRIIRPSSDPAAKPKVFELNFKKMMAKGDTRMNVLLQEGDIIYVPPTVLASVGKTVQELTMPVNSTFSTINVVQRTVVGPAGTQTGP